MITDVKWRLASEKPLRMCLKSFYDPQFVIQAKAGIQAFQCSLDPGACPGRDPGFAGVTEWKDLLDTL